jgi:mannose-1-phosphate guanylyltransferase
MFENYYAVIMAGGGGTRLWPLSRQTQPKQMVRLFGDRTMFQISVDRLKGLFPSERIFIVTTEDQARHLKTLCPEIPSANYVIEPSPKNTASVVGLAAVCLQKHDPAAVMAILTADHFIENIPRFHQVLRSAYEVAEQEFLVTLGIHPTYPATGYGYIQVGSAIGTFGDLAVYSGLRFLEKPDVQKAQEFFDDGSYFWNSGMFVWKADQIIVEFARQTPELYAGLQRISRSWNAPDRIPVTNQVWETIQPISIDYAIMEGAENVAVIPSEGLGWSDVGSWDSLFELLGSNQDGNIIQDANFLGFDTQNTLVFGNNDQRLIVTVGVEDLVIVDTGDVMMVCNRAQAQQIRQVVQSLKEQNSKFA